MWIRCLGVAGVLMAVATSCGGGEAADAPSSPASSAPASSTTAQSSSTTTTSTTTTTTTSTTTTVPPLPEGYEGHVSAIYADQAHWVCFPGSATDACSRNLDTTSVFADGSTEVIPHVPADDPPLDCFYVYPTASFDESSNSDLIPDENAEISTTVAQAARLTATCRVFAPVYRQITIPALFGRVDRDPNGSEIAQADVVDAFRHYIANHNDGRPFMVIGHSQGAGRLASLLADEVDHEPALLDRLEAAFLLGTSIDITRYDNIDACETIADRGCIYSWSSYRESDPPAEGGIFGRTESGSAVCSDPVAIAGGGAHSRPYFEITSQDGTQGAVPFADPARNAEITTTWVSYPDLVRVACVDDGTYAYLELRVDADPSDPRTDDIGGDFLPGWGMHIVDVSVVMGDIVDIVEQMAAPA